MIHHTRRTALTTMAAGLTGILLASCGGATEPAGPEGTGAAGGESALTLGLVQGKDFVHAMPARVAEAQGIFKKHGLNVKIVGFSSGSDLTKAMAGGSVQAAAATGLDAVAATAKGVPLQAFYGVMAASPMALMVPEDSSIAGWADLQGKRVAISKIGSLTDYTLRASLKKVNVPLEDVTEVPLGDPASTMAGMERGDVDAFILPINYGFVIEAKGTGKVAQPASQVLGDDDQFAILMATKEFAASDSAILTKLTQAYTESITWIQENKEQTVSLAAAQLNMDPGIAAKTYEALVPDLSTDGALNEPGMATYADALPELGIAKEVPAKADYLNTAILGG